MGPSSPLQLPFSGGLMLEMDLMSAKTQRVTRVPPKAYLEGCIFLSCAFVFFVTPLEKQTLTLLLPIKGLAVFKGCVRNRSDWLPDCCGPLLLHSLTLHSFS